MSDTTKNAMKCSRALVYAFIFVLLAKRGQGQAATLGYVGASAEGNNLKATFRLGNWTGYFNLTARVPAGTSLTNTQCGKPDVVLMSDLEFNLRPRSTQHVDRARK